MMETVLVRKQSFGAALKEARQSAELTQSDVGALMGLTDAAISQWESGGNPPKPEVVFELEEKLGLAPGRLSRSLGYVPAQGADVVDTLTAIESDPNLADDQKEMLKVAYLAARRHRRRR